MRTLLLFFLLIVGWNSFAQGFSQINQTPLIYHGSFAGATGAGRLAWVSNLTTYNASSHFSSSPVLNNYLSYDNLWKKRGIGWGASLQSNNLLGSSSSGFTQNTRSERYVANISIASKHVLFSKSSGKANYTLSPSFSMGYAFGTYQSGSSSTYSVWGIENYLENHKIVNVTVGLLLNSKYGYFGFGFKNTYLKYRKKTPYENPRPFISNYDNYSTDPTQTSTSSLFYPSFSFVFAQTMSSHRKNSLFSLTPSGYVSLDAFYKRPAGYPDASFLQLTTYSFNITAMFWKIYFGVGTTNTLATNHQVFTGFKNDRFRTGIGYGWRPSDKNIQSFWELSLSYFFKPAVDKKSIQ